MQPIKPGLLHGQGWREAVYAKDQPEYLPLPVLKCVDGRVVSRWQPTKDERQAIAGGADIFLTLHTFNLPLQPIQMQVGAYGVDTTAVGIPEKDPEVLKESLKAHLSKAG